MVEQDVRGLHMVVRFVQERSYAMTVIVEHHCLIDGNMRLILVEFRHAWT